VRVRAVDDGGTENGGEDTSAEKSFTITIVAVNDPPVTAADWDWGTEEDSGEIRILINPLANDRPGPATATDEASQTLELIAVTNGTGGTVRLSGGRIYFTPAPDFHGNASFTYIVRDSEGATATGTVYVPVAPVADKPVASGGSVAEDSQITISVERNPVDGAEVTHFTFYGIENGKLYRAGGLTEITGGYITVWQASTVTFVPDPDFTGRASFCVRAATSAAGSGLSEPTCVEISVTPVNDAPRAADDILESVAEDSGRRTIPFATLIENDTPGPADESYQILNITAVSPLIGGTVSIEDSNVVFTPAPDFNGTASFSYTVTDDDPDPKSATATVSFTITPVNDAPVGADDVLIPVVEDGPPLRIAFDDLLSNDSPGPATALDEVGQTLTIIAVSDPIGGTVEIDGTNVIFTLEPNFTGMASFTYILRDDGTTNGVPDPKSAAVPTTVTIPVQPVADAPQITPTVTAEDTQSTSGLVITRNAVGGAEVTHFEITGITGGTLYLNDGITPIADGQFITAAQAGAGLKFTPAPDANTLAGDTFTFMVRGALDASGTGLGEAANAVITVSEVNDAPKGAADTLPAKDEDSGPWTIPFATLTENDSAGPPNESGQSLTISSVGEAVGGTVTIVGTDVIFTPAADFHGTASFTYTVTDNGTTNSAADPKSAAAQTTVTIPVTPVNDAPSFAAGPAQTVKEDAGPQRIPNWATNISAGPNEADQTVSFEVSSDKSELFTADGQPAVDAAGTLTFTPAPDAYGSATVAVTLKDNGGTANGGVDATTKTFTVTITPVNDAPVFALEGDVTVLEDSGVYTAANFLTGRSAVEADQTLTLTVSIEDEARALFSAEPAIDDDGTLTFTPAPDAYGTAAVTVTLQDDGGTDDGGVDTTVKMFTITITPVNDAPVAENQRVSGTVGRTISGTVKATDVENDPLTYTVVSWPSKGTLTMDENGAFTYSSSHSGQDSFTFKANDGIADSNVATVTVQVRSKSGGGSGGATGPTQPTQPTQPTEPATPEEPVGGPDAQPPEGSTGESNPPVHQEVDAGQPAEVKVLNFQVNLPGDATTEPLRLQVVSPTANTDAIRLAEGSADFAGTGDGELTRQADGTSVSKVRATVTFEYDPQSVSDPSILRIFYFDTKHNVWVEIGGEVNSQTHTISVQVGHFTTFAALVPRADAPVLPALPVEVRSEKLTVSGTAPAGMPVTLVINGDAQVNAVTDGNGRYTMEGRLAAGQNWVYVKGTGVLASREWSVTYRPAESYTDTAGHWAEGTIKRLAELSIATVYPAPLFEPEAKVTRLEFAVMVARVMGLEPMDEAPVFTDTASMPEWSWPEVTAAYEAGIIKGMPDGSFAPDRLVSRAEMAVMLTRALEYAGKDITPGDHRFADEAAIADWAKDQVHAAARWGLIAGYPDGTFRPAGDTTRAEAVTMLERLLDQASE